MTKITKPVPDKFKMKVLKQDEPKLPPRPATMGEPVESIDWMKHNGENIEYYTRIMPNEKNEKMAYVYRPNPGMQFALDVQEKFWGLILPYIAVYHAENKVIIDYFPAAQVQFIQFFTSKPLPETPEEAAK